MCIERYVRLVAGGLVLLSVLLSRAVSPWFLGIAVFVGINLVQASISRWCLLSSLLGRLGIPSCNAIAPLPGK